MPFFAKNPQIFAKNAIFYKTANFSVFFREKRRFSQKRRFLQKMPIFAKTPIFVNFFFCKHYLPQYPHGVRGLNPAF
jgi:hypothetical protein